MKQISRIVMYLYVFWLGLTPFAWSMMRDKGSESFSPLSTQVSAPHPPSYVEREVNLLCLDGGGIRGVATAEILRYIESEKGVRIKDMGLS